MAKKIVDSRTYCLGIRILIFRRFIDLTILFNTLIFAFESYPGDVELE